MTMETQEPEMCLVEATANPAPVSERKNLENYVNFDVVAQFLKIEQ